MMMDLEDWSGGGNGTFDGRIAALHALGID